MKKQSMLAHACLMVGRKLKSYALLSVTVVLSLSLLLGYMIFTDSQIYNKNKQLFSHDANLTEVLFDWGETELETTFLKNAEKLGEIYDIRKSYNVEVMIGQNLAVNEVSVGGIGAKLISVDSQFLMDSLTEEVYGYEIIWLDGRQREYPEVNPGEILLDEEIYYALGLDKFEDPIFHYRISDAQNQQIFVTPSLRVTGLLRATSVHAYSLADYVDERMQGEDAYYTCCAFVNKRDISPADFASECWGTTLSVYCESPSEVAQLAERMSDRTYAFCWAEEQAQALRTIRTEKQTKATIAMALLLLLGINLYSCFSNALADRRFEISVKRALGASRWAVIRQFLYESLLIMLVNILISISVVTFVMLIYKYYFEMSATSISYTQIWTVYLSPYTFAIFAVCAVTLTVVFSLVFAYKATQVEIVQYLKAE